AKQKLKGYYGDITEKQFKSVYTEAVRRRGDTGQILVGLLETRLDAVVYRAKFVPTVFAARQFVNHGHVTVNGKRVNIPSYMVKAGDVIEIREKSRQIPMVIQAIESPERDVPEYITTENDGRKATFVRVPSLDEIPYPVVMEPNLVVEFYSR
ncbi:MAG TPA: 30S ribosomal protein S4, partial [Emcibacteraceae bacterium]|nr:30S ribosomal protein S4 [Emcibacteraceae bacterium]